MNRYIALSAACPTYDFCLNHKTADHGTRGPEHNTPKRGTTLHKFLTPFLTILSFKAREA